MLQQATKICSKCKIVKFLDSFSKRKLVKSGYKSECKVCSSIRRKHNYIKNKNKENNYSTEYKKANKKTVNISNRTYKLSKLKATPKWANLVAIKAKYQLAAMFNKETEQTWHVDHIVPLQGTNVCGLHVEYNLRVIPAKENLSKGNKY